MTFEVGVTGEFEAAHALVGDFGPAAERHTHAYRVAVAVRGARLAGDGTLIDITILNNALAGWVARLDGQFLNDVEGLNERNTTAENVAAFGFETIEPHLRGRGLESLRVTVWESAVASASFESSLDQAP